MLTSVEVTLDLLGGPHLGEAGILTGIPPSAPLAQQVPTLVELLLEVPQPLLGLVVQLPRPCTQLVLFRDQVVDVRQDRLVVHVDPNAVGGPAVPTRRAGPYGLASTWTPARAPTHEAGSNVRPTRG